MPDLPAAPVMPRRNPRVAAQPHGTDLILYNPDTVRCHRLNAIALRVWEACDGVSTVPQVAERLGLPARPLVHLALYQFAGLGLLAPGTPVNRRFRRFAAPPDALPRIDTVDLGRPG